MLAIFVGGKFHACISVQVSEKKGKKGGKKMAAIH